MKTNKMKKTYIAPVATVTRMYDVRRTLCEGSKEDVEIDGGEDVDDSDKVREEERFWTNWPKYW